MNNPNTKELRPRPFLIGKIAELVGGRETAAEMAGCSRDTLDKCCNPKAGRDLTVEDIAKLIQGAGLVVGNPDLDGVVDELAGYFVPPRRKLVYDQLVDHISAGLEALKNGGRLKPAAVVSCECGNQNLVRVDRGGVMTFVCSVCLQGAVRE